MRYTDLLDICEFCAHKNPDEIHRKQHINGFGQFTCMFCPKRTKVRQKMLTHIESHKKIQFECTVCDFKTYVYEYYRRHAYMIHRRFGCNSCDERRETRTKMEQHLAAKFHNPPNN